MQLPYITYCIFPQLEMVGILICFMVEEANSEKLRDVHGGTQITLGPVRAQSWWPFCDVYRPEVGLGPRGSRNGKFIALGLESGLMLNLILISCMALSKSLMLLEFLSLHLQKRHNA